MNSFKAAEYEIIPTETYKILRNCPGCGSKTVCRSTNKVRVNAIPMLHIIAPDENATGG